MTPKGKTLVWRIILICYSFQHWTSLPGIWSVSSITQTTAQSWTEWTASLWEEASHSASNWSSATGSTRPASVPSPASRKQVASLCYTLTHCGFCWFLPSESVGDQNLLLFFFTFLSFLSFFIPLYRSFFLSLFDRFFSLKMDTLDAHTK